MVLIGVSCLVASGCAGDKHYRDEQGVLKTEHRTADGINTGVSHDH